MEAELSDLFNEYNLVKILESYYKKIIIISNRDTGSIFNVFTYELILSFKLSIHKQIYIVDDNIIYIHDSHICRLNLLTFEIIKIPFECDAYYMYKHNGNIFISCYRHTRTYFEVIITSMHIYNPVNDSLRVMNKNIYISTFYKNKIISCNNSYFIQLLDIETEEISIIELSIKSKAYCVYGDYIILEYGNTNIMLIDINNGKIHKKIENVYSLSIKNILVYNDKLIVDGNDIGIHYIRALDINTGIMTKQIKQIAMNMKVCDDILVINTYFSIDRYNSNLEPINQLHKFKFGEIPHEYEIDI